MAEVQSRTQGTKVDMEGLMPKMLSMTLTDDKGILLFEESDIDALNQKSGEVLDRLFLVAQHVNGIGREAIEEQIANFAVALNTGSGSD